MSRSNKTLVVLACILSSICEAGPLRVVTYNVASGASVQYFPNNGAMNFAGVAALINSFHPDVVVLNEVDNNLPGQRPPSIYQPSYWSTLLALPYFDYRAWNFMYDSAGPFADNGVQILSRYPISAIVRDNRVCSACGVLVNVAPWFYYKYPDNKGMVVVETPQGPVRVAAMHLEWYSGSPQVPPHQRLAGYISWLGSSSTITVLAGDTNMGQSTFYGDPSPPYPVLRTTHELIPRADDGDVLWMLVGKSAKLGMVVGKSIPPVLISSNPLVYELSDHALVYAEIYPASLLGALVSAIQL